MKRLFAITTVMFLSSAMFFVVVCAGGGPVSKPFKAMWTGTVYVLGPCTDPAFPPALNAFQVINVGKGVSTLTGESNFISSYCSYFTSLTEAVGSGWAILTAANGDTLHLSIELTLDTSDLPDGPVRWTETETPVGGTGRFEGATGESNSEGTWTSGTNLYPYDLNETAYKIPPLLAQPPQGWIGTTKGRITF